LVIRVSGRSARVRISATAGADTAVEGGHVQHCADGSMDVSSTSSAITITCPPDTSVTVSTASGSVSVHGQLGAVQVVTSSGKVEIEQASELEVRTASGRVEVGECQRNCRVTTQSGRIDVGASGGVELSSTAGRVTVGQAQWASVRTVSGRIEIGATAAATIEAHTISGKVAVRVAGQLPARMQLSSQSGSIKRDVPDGDGGARIEVTTTSGSIAIERP
jgi:DUF4097 and DUF4098 domain-containing protein YvlB